jgi:diaminopimelate decarboxylase
MTLGDPTGSGSTPPGALAGLDDLETPAYVYDLDQVRRAYRQLRAALPEPSRIYYSLKANPHPAIVATLTRLGCHAEVCSPGELTAALDADVPAGHILYTGPGKRDAEVAEAVKAGVSWFSVDSPLGRDQVVRAAAAAGEEVNCLLRINDQAPTVGQGLNMTGVASQFGADADWVSSQPASFRGGLAGLHLYQGTQLPNEDALVASWRAALGTARRLSDALGAPPRLLNLGGGFPAPFARTGDLPRLPTLADRLADLLDECIPTWRDQRPLIAFESGRYLVATCGQLLTRVVDVKSSHGLPVVVLESGINHLGGLSGLRRLPPIVPDITAAPGTGQPDVLHHAIIAGPLCTPLDSWARSAQLPAVHPGDLVRVPNVGAYGLSASLLAFLSHPVAREVVVDGGAITDVSQLALVRRALPAHHRTGKEA